MNYISIILLASSAFLFSCKKKAQENPATTPDPVTGVVVKTGSVKLDLQHVVGSGAVALFTDYVNASSETFQITALKYYVSNVKLRKPDGSFTAIANTYFLIDVSQANKSTGTFTATIPNVPEGNYNGVSFMLGVDSVQTESGAQTGDLSPEKGMLWAWEGYRALVFEGNSPSSTTVGNYFQYQTFGYKGQYSALQNVSIDFGGSLLMAKQNALPIIHLSVDLLEFFKNPSNISIARIPKSEAHADSLNQAISRNYVDMFRFEHIHN